MNRFQKFRLLSSSERSLVWGALWRVAFARIGLCFLPLERVKKLIAKCGGRVRPCPIERVVWAVQASSAVIPRSTCLVRAIAVQELLQKQGKNSHLVLGVALDETEEFQAHAWVEYEGRTIIGDTPAAHYQQLLIVNAHK